MHCTNLRYDFVVCGVGRATFLLVVIDGWWLALTGSATRGASILGAEPVELISLAAAIGASRATAVAVVAAGRDAGVGCAIIAEAVSTHHEPAAALASLEFCHPYHLLSKELVSRLKSSELYNFLLKNSIVFTSFDPC